ncbi:short chain dehydrogenase/reductase [Thelonectria olida]|uniref:Short-chain dehydrogenase/reductase 3 n=1 Tax=Thelonectria olida TaxID=1576542 RepID=A0A9P8W1N2_9HYPO|nr:short chain dehydrogenase/reductase [Thelonectria olida]
MNSLQRLVEMSHVKKALGTLAGLALFYATYRLVTGKGTSNSYQWDWQREVVLVTGGSNGIGELVARKLAGRGIKVVALDLRPPKTPFPNNIYYYQLDVTSPKEIRRVAQSIRQDVGEPTVLINNAGVASLKTILDETDEEIRRTFDVNVIAHFFLIREFLPRMISQNHGHIITIASMASFVTLASNVDYSCSKAGALAFHEGLAQELKYKYNARNVQTSVVHPMWIRTTMFDSALKKGTLKDTLLQPNDVAKSIVALVLRGKSSQIFLPWYFSAASALRGFPTWIQECLRGLRADLL